MNRLSAPSIPLGCRVVKVGGSLLDDPQLPQRCSRWLEQQTARPSVLVAGGGELVDVVRRLDRRFSLGESTSHHLSIELLGVTAKLLARLLPGASLAEDPNELLRRLPKVANLSCVFDPRRFLEEIEPQLDGSPLPHSWHVTSDSITARLARWLAADELVLLKSATVPADSESLGDVAEHGLVDSYFPTAARDVTAVRIVALRDAKFAETRFVNTQSPDDPPPRRR